MGGGRNYVKKTKKTVQERLIEDEERLAQEAEDAMSGVSGQLSEMSVQSVEVGSLRKHHNIIINFQVEMNALNLFNLPKTEQEAVEFLQQRGVLPIEKKCAKGHLMTLNFINDTTSKIRWECWKDSCRKTEGVRKGTWFEYASGTLNRLDYK